MQENIEKFVDQMNQESVESLNYGDITPTVEKHTPVDPASVVGASDVEAVDYRELMTRMRTKPLVRNFRKIRRNEQCPCGSGKKYKNCCLENGKFEGYHIDKKAA